MLKFVRSEHGISDYMCLLSLLGLNMESLKFVRSEHGVSDYVFVKFVRYEHIHQGAL